MLKHAKIIRVYTYSGGQRGLQSAGSRSQSAGSFGGSLDLPKFRERECILHDTGPQTTRDVSRDQKVFLDFVVGPPQNVCPVSFLAASRFAVRLLSGRLKILQFVECIATRSNPHPDSMPAFLGGWCPRAICPRPHGKFDFGGPPSPPTTSDKTDGAPPSSRTRRQASITWQSTRLWNPAPPSRLIHPAGTHLGVAP